MMRWSLILILAACLTASCMATIPPLPFISVPQMSVSGDLSLSIAAEPWKGAALIPEFSLIEANGQPQDQTQVRLAHDGQNLYLHVACHESNMERLTTNAKSRDAAVWADDAIEIFIGDVNVYYHIVVNAIGAIADEKCTGNGETKDVGWNASVTVKTDKNTDTWQLALRVPLAELELKPGASAGINICRNRVPGRELSCWSPTLSGFHQPARFGQMTLSDNSRALTGLDWGKPWPGLNKVTARIVGGNEVEVKIAAIAAKHQELKVNAAQSEYAYTLPFQPQQVVEYAVSTGGELLSRQYYLSNVTDYQPELKKIDQLLQKLSQKDERIIAAKEQMKQLELTAQKPQDSDADKWNALRDTVQSLGEQMRWLALRDEAQNLAKQQPFYYAVHSSLEKILRHMPFTGKLETPLHMSAARNEVEAMQLCVFAFDEALSNVRVSFNDLKGSKSGDVLPASCLSWRQVQDIKTEQPTYTVPFVGLWPDPLVSVDSVNVAKDTYERLWITLRVPRGVRGGEYNGFITITSENHPTRQVPISVRVYDFSLPRYNHLKTAFGVGTGGLDAEKWFNNVLDHRITPYSITGAEVKPARFDFTGFESIAFSARVLNQEIGNRVNFNIQFPSGQEQFGPLNLGEQWSEQVVPLTGDVSNISTLSFTFTGTEEGQLEVKDLRLVGAWGTRRLMADDRDWFGTGGVTLSGNLLDGLKMTLGKAEQKTEWLSSWPSAVLTAWDSGNIPPSADFTQFDTETESWMRKGQTQFLVPVPSAWYQQPVEAAVIQLRNSGTAAISRLWAEHLREKGWLANAYTYMADEPETHYFPTLNAILAETHRGAPDLANMMTARGAGTPGLQNVDIWCPEVYSFNPDGAATEQAKNKEVWWYVAFSTRHPYPNYWIDYPALDCRVLPWMSWKHNLDGILYWSMNYRIFDTWKTGMCYAGANGDGHLTYPAEDGGVVDSIRWEAIRDGQEDYEYFWLLSELVKEANRRGIEDAKIAEAKDLLAIDNNVVRSFKDYNPDYTKLLATRDKMAVMIETLRKQLSWFPQDVPATPRHRIPAPNTTERRSLGDMTNLKTSSNAITLTSTSIHNDPGVYLSFDTSMRYAIDTSGAENHGIVVEGQYVPGKMGQGLHLSGNNPGIRLPGSMNLLGAQAKEGTYALWVCPDDDPKPTDDVWSGHSVFIYAQKTNTNGLPDGYNEIGLMQHGTHLIGRLSANEGQSVVAAVLSPLRKGQWTHLAFTWTPNGCKLYINGKVAAQQNVPIYVPVLDNFPASVGKHLPSGKWSFAGIVDEVIIRNQAMSDEEISKLAQ